MYSSVYQDIPVNALEDFMQLAPAEARTERVLADEHQLMLNRLSFELSERQRYATVICVALYTPLSTHSSQVGTEAQGAHQGEGGAPQRKQGATRHCGERQDPHRQPYEGLCAPPLGIHEECPIHTFEIIDGHRSAEEGSRPRPAPCNNIRTWAIHTVIMTEPKPHSP